MINRYLDQDQIKKLWNHICDRALPKPTKDDAGKIVVSDGTNGYKLVSFADYIGASTLLSSSGNDDEFLYLRGKNGEEVTLYWTTDKSG